VLRLRHDISNTNVPLESPYSPICTNNISLSLFLFSLYLGFSESPSQRTGFSPGSEVSLSFSLCVCMSAMDGRTRFPTQTSRNHAAGGFEQLHDDDHESPRRPTPRHFAAARSRMDRILRRKGELHHTSNTSTSNGIGSSIVKEEKNEADPTAGGASSSTISSVLVALALSMSIFLFALVSTGEIKTLSSQLFPPPLPPRNCSVFLFCFGEEKRLKWLITRLYLRKQIGQHDHFDRHPQDHPGVFQPG
jgi:hypothetical protein